MPKSGPLLFHLSPVQPLNTIVWSICYGGVQGIIYCSHRPGRQGPGEIDSDPGSKLKSKCYEHLTKEINGVQIQTTKALRNTYSKEHLLSSSYSLWAVTKIVQFAVTEPLYQVTQVI